MSRSRRRPALPAGRHSLSSHLSSAVQVWSPLGPAGTTVSALWIDRAQPNILIAAIEAGGPLPGVLYRTLDGGANWQRADQGISGAIQAVIGELGSAKLYAQGNQTWRSVDLGEVECLIDGGDISLADIDPPEPLLGKALYFLARLPGAADYGDSQRPTSPCISGRLLAVTNV